MLTTHHGLTFGIDTADWSNSVSAEKAADRLENWLQALDAEATARLHTGLLAEREGDDTAPYQDILDAAESAAGSIQLGIWEEEAWHMQPNTGHNCALYVPTEE